MKMLFMVTDSEYEHHCMNMLKEKGVEGYTVIPNVLGFGRSGAKMGDRLHPGAPVLVFSVIPDESAETLIETINQCMKDERLCQSTHAWLMPVEAAISGS